jgi:hypothetical protein
VTRKRCEELLLRRPNAKVEPRANNTKVAASVGWARERLDAGATPSHSWPSRNAEQVSADAEKRRLGFNSSENFK